MWIKLLWWSFLFVHLNTDLNKGVHQSDDPVLGGDVRPCRGWGVITLDRFFQTDFIFFRYSRIALEGMLVF